MNFLADESVDRPIVERLRRDGHQVSYVAELGPGMPDDDVLNLANQEAALLLTADKDFGEMVFRQRLHTHGVVLIRLAGLLPARKAEIVALAIREHLTELGRSFAVITPGMFRIRRQGILPLVSGRG
jgi:predicted nuclease of predicted toxin-antitoxin system